MTKNYKQDFPLLMSDPTVYLDNAATAQYRIFTPAKTQTRSAVFMS